MSRSIGDWEWKRVGVTAEPLVDVIDVSNLTQPFLVAASDGLWDLRRPQFFAKQFGRSFYGGERHPLVACVETILQVSPQKKEWYRDDITVIVLLL
jgi:serine/threonine protein phosphatase PrpC